MKVNKTQWKCLLTIMLLIWNLNFQSFKVLLMEEITTKSDIFSIGMVFFSSLLFSSLLFSSLLFSFLFFSFLFFSSLLSSPLLFSSLLFSSLTHSLRSCVPSGFIRIIYFLSSKSKINTWILCIRKVRYNWSINTTTQTNCIMLSLW